MDNQRAYLYLPYYLRMANCLYDLEVVLTDLKFISFKCDLFSQEGDYGFCFDSIYKLIKSLTYRKKCNRRLFYISLDRARLNPL